MRLMALWVLLAAVAAVPANAGVYPDSLAEAEGMELVEFTCPIGGEAFRQPVTHPHLALETFSDGSHLGDNWVDTQVPLCPGNGLVLLPLAERDPETGVPHYHQYSDDELALLETLIASADYRALAGETRYLRAYWIGKQLGLPATDLWQMLHVASWSADRPEQRETALTMFVADGPELLSRSTDEGEALYHGRIYLADALRQLGRFDEALELLATMGPDPANPEPELAEAWIFSDEPIDRRIRAMVKEGNTDRFPIALQPSRLANLICNDPDVPILAPAENAASDCRRREAAMAVQAEFREEVRILRRNEEALAIGCRDIPLENRSDPLIAACEGLEFSKLVESGRERFRTNPAETAALCESGGTLHGAEVFACEEYERARFDARKWLLVSDDEAYDIACVREPDLFVDPESHDLTVCAAARDDRWNIEGWELWLDRANLGPRCAALTDDAEYSSLEVVCERIAEGDDEPYFYPQEADPEPDDPAVQVALARTREQIAIAKARLAATIGGERE